MKARLLLFLYVLLAPPACIAALFGALWLVGSLLDWSVWAGIAFLWFLLCAFLVLAPDPPRHGGKAAP